MKILRTYVPDSLANYNHLIYCPETRRAAAVDPYSADHLLALAEAHHLHIEQIWITHEHGDHIRDMKRLKAATDAKVYAPMTCSGLFAADYWLDDKQLLSLGGYQVLHLLTPGHTPGHGIFFYSDENESENNFLVCADTLFNAGVGNTRSGSTEELYLTVQRLKETIDSATRIYPGHDYICTNLKFVLHHFPDCAAADATLTEVTSQTPETRSVQTLKDEYRYNPFLSPEADWISQHPDFAELTVKERFFELRSRRDEW